jgi:hypothetical protein
VSERLAAETTIVAIAFWETTSAGLKRCDNPPRPAPLDAAGDDFDNVGSGSLPTWKDTKEDAWESGHPERDRKHLSVQ